MKGSDKMSENNVFTQLQNDVKNTPIEHPTVTLPIKHLGRGNFEFANGVKCRMTVEGAGYFSERIRTVPYAWWTNAARNSYWDQIEKKINANLDKFTRDKYVAAIFDGKLVGIMANYNPIPHAKLLEAIKSAKLDSEVRYGDLSETEMNVVIDIKTLNDVEGDEALLVGLRITNGHSGHSALRYNLYLRSGGYDWSDGSFMSGRARHLSKVDALVGEMKTSFDLATEVKLVDRLRAVSASMVWSTLDAALPKKTMRQERMIANLQSMSDVQTALDIVMTLGRQAGVRGNLSAVAGIVDPICKMAMEIVTASA
jgi:hypothetical protein